MDSNILTIAQEPYACHEHIDRILDLAKKRSEELGLVVAKFYDGHASMASFLFPTAEPDRVVSATLFFNLLYYIDDVFGEDMVVPIDISELGHQLMEVWQGRGTNIRAPDFDNLLSTTAWIRSDILTNSGTSFLDRLTTALKQHLHHVFRPKLYSSIEQYLETRAHFCGMYPTILIAEFASNRYITPAIEESIPSLMCARAACLHIGGLSNDIFSYPKERHSDFNLVNAHIKLGLAKDLTQAIEQSVDIVNHFHEVFRSSIEESQFMMKRLSPESCEVVETHVRVLQSIVSASYHWQLYTNRYRDAHHFLEDFR